MSLIVSTDESFTELTKTGIVLVDFWANWCGPCQVMLPRLEEIATKLGSSVTVAKHNVDEQGNTPPKFRIMSIPTLILFKNGEVIEKFTGVQEADPLLAVIKKYM